MGQPVRNQPLGLHLAPGEPEAQAWHPVPVAALAASLVTLVARRAGEATEIPRVIAVDGRSGGGKTTLASRLVDHLPGAALVHTDDLAWWEPMFAWAPRMLELVAAVRGGATSYRPPQWSRRGREGAIEVPRGVSVLVVEGVGSSGRDAREVVDAAIWVQSDRTVARERGLARDIASGENGDAAASAAFWEAWDRDELAYLAQDRPWERADIVALGTPPPSLTPGPGEVLLGRFATPS